MLADFANGRKQEPLTPDGWIFIADALIAAMNSFDDQRASVALRIKGEEPKVWHTYQDLAALDPRDSTMRVLARRQIKGVRFDDLQSSAYGAAELLTKACEAGRIRSGTRRVGGGVFLKLPTRVWGLDAPWRRFWSCQMDPMHPFALNQGHWIFLEGDGLYAEIDNWRTQHCLAPIWTVQEQPQPTERENKQPTDVKPRLAVPELERWFAKRVAAFADRSPPTWQECWAAAKMAYPDNTITRDMLQNTRREIAPEWRSGRR